MSAISKSRPSTYRMALGLSFISGSLLALEILYVRMVSVLLFPVATYLVISLALLGLGTSGGLLSLLSRNTLSRRLLGIGATAFSYSILLSLAAMWFASRSNVLALLLPVLLAFPMFFGGIALSGVLSMPASRIPILYFADLVGAGTSALLVLVGLNVLGAIQVALLTGMLGLVSAAILFGARDRRWALLSIVIFGVVLVLSPRLPNGIIPISPKELRLISDIEGPVDWEYQGWSALARVDVLSVPGDELALNGGLPYKLVTHDGGAPSLLLKVDGRSQERLLIDDTIFGVPYWIKERPDVLVIGLGGGPDVVAALAGGAASVTGAEVSPEMISIVKNQFAAFVGDPYADPRVQIRLTDGRHLLASSDHRYDLIQLTGVDTTVASLGGNPNLAENYLYTQEAFVAYLDHLKQGGILSVSFPNVEGLGLRLVALTSEALQAEGVTDFRDHVIVGEMTGYVHVLVSKDPFAPADIETLKRHYAAHPTSVYFPLYHRLFGQPAEDFIAESRLVLVPGEAPIEPYAGFVDALNENDESAFLKSQPYTLQPPTDEWPFFFVLDKLGFRTPNYDALFLTLGCLVMFSVLLMIVPPWLLRRRGTSVRRSWAIIAYFACLGLGFIFVEVVFIQKLSLIVGHPSYSLATVLAALLISSGAGSLMSDRSSLSMMKKATAATAAVATLVMLTNIGLDVFGDFILRLSLPLRVLLTSLIVALPGFFMGMPFPTGLNLVQRTAPTFIPWGWGINATFTTIGTILSLILAMTYGFNEVLIAAAALYLLALVSVNVFEGGAGLRDEAG